MDIKRSTIEVSEKPDGTEFRQILYDLTSPSVTEDAVDDCTARLANALADWLSKATPDEDGRLHGAIKNGLVLRLVPVAEHEGHGFADETPIPAHLALHIKASEGMLDVFSEYFGKPVKNG